MSSLLHKQYYSPTSTSHATGNAPQVLLVLIALASVPVMLLPKPLILKERHKKRAAQLQAYGRVSPTDADDEESSTLHIAAPHGGHDEEEFDFSEVVVHQVRGLMAPAASSCFQSAGLRAIVCCTWSLHQMSLATASGTVSTPLTRVCWLESG